MSTARRTLADTPPCLSTIILCGAYVALVVLALSNLSHAAFPFNGLDEQGHISYTIHLIHDHRWWPDFLHFPMVDLATGATLDTPNYINHPPTFYWPMKVLSEAFPSLAPLHFRYFSLALSLLAMLLYMRLGAALAMPLAGTILYALFPFLLYLHVQIGFYSNDAMALLGGLVATHASLHWLNAENPPRALIWMLLGVLLASVKLTSLLLVGSYVAMCLLLRLRALFALPNYLLLVGLIVALICAAPYAYLFVAFGSPAPKTIGQIAQLNECLGCTHHNMPFHEWLGYFLGQFANQLAVIELTFLPILAYIAALLAVLRPRALHAQPLRAMAVASAVATLLTLTIHTAFSWQRYREYGWIFDSLLRYYLPLIGAYAAVTCHALKPRPPMPNETP